MAKKKKGKVVQMLSPEKYIKTKSRSLPIHECWIFSGWEESQMANIIISRQHKNGNITYGFYLVDLGCLGVKDAFFRFNNTETEYHNFIERLQRDRTGLQRADYKLVHNIIFAAVEFAEDFGFFPHKDFTSLMQYFLEEDTDNIELMEIECGNDGKPLYTQGPHENDAKARKIIAQLEKVAGTGNFDYVLNAEEEYFDNNADNLWEEEEEDNRENQDWNDKEAKLEEKYARFPDSEKIIQIKNLITKEAENENTEGENAEVAYLVNSIVTKHINYISTEKISNTLVEKLEELEVVDEFPDEFFAAIPGEISEDFKIKFNELFEIVHQYPKRAAKKIKKLRKVMPENPTIAYLEILLLQTQKSDDFKHKLKLFHQKFPTFPLIKMVWDHAVTFEEKGGNAEELFLKGPEVYFFERKKLHHVEVINYLITLVLIATSQQNMTLLSALDFVLQETPLSESNFITLNKMSFYSKLNFIFSMELERHSNK